MDTKLWFSIWRVGIVLIVCAVGIIILHLVLRDMESRIKKSKGTREREKRLITLVHAGYSFGYVLVIVLGLLMILHELGINITPILASAGVVGLAFSLGSQTVIKDYLAGVVILVENLYSISDVISVGQVTGTVEHISIRATNIRDAEGKLIVIPNGDIRTYSNLTIQWAQIIINLNFDYAEDMDRVVSVLEESITTLMENKEIAEHIKDTPSVLGWTGFTDWAVQAQIIVKTSPGKQWLVARGVRRHALEVLANAGIRPAIPRQRVENL